MCCVRILKMATKETRKAHLEVYQALLAEALTGKVPTKHEDNKGAYIQFLKKEIMLMEKVLNGGK